MTPKRINKVKALFKPKYSDKNPIKTGPNKNPTYAMVDTLANAIEGLMFFAVPALEYMIGTIVDIPNPATAQPKIIK